MNFLADMGISPRVVEELRQKGYVEYSRSIIKTGTSQMLYDAPVTHLSWRTVPGQVCDREGIISQ